MKKIVYGVGLLLLAVLIPLGSEAQILRGFGKKLEQKVEEQINRRVERQADNAINSGLDKIENAAEETVRGVGKKKTPNENSSNSGFPGFPMGDSDISLADSYEFTLGVTYNVQNGTEKTIQTSMWFGSADYVGMSIAQQKNIFMVLHGANIITFMEDDKRYMVMGGDMATGIVEAAMEEAENEGHADEFSIKKIGTERILNYNCDVYEAKSPEYSTKLWLTTALDVETGHFMSAFGQLAKSGLNGLPNLHNQANGVLLKMEGKSLTDNQSVHMEATNIHKDGKRIDSKDYKSFSF